MFKLAQNSNYYAQRSKQKCPNFLQALSKSGDIEKFPPYNADLKKKSQLQKLK